MSVRVQSGVGVSSWAQWGRVSTTGRLSSMPVGPQLTTGVRTVWLPSEGSLQHQSIHTQHTHTHTHTNPHTHTHTHTHTFCQRVNKSPVITHKSFTGTEKETPAAH